MNRSITLSELKKLSPQLIGSKIKIVSIVKGMKYTLLGVITFTKNIHQGRRINYTTVYFDVAIVNVDNMYAHMLTSYYV